MHRLVTKGRSVCHETKREEEYAGNRAAACNCYAAVDDPVCALIRKIDTRGDDRGGERRNVRVYLYSNYRVCSVFLLRDTNAAKKDPLGTVDCNRLSLPFAALQFTVFRSRLRAYPACLLLHPRRRFSRKLPRRSKTS